MRISRIIQNIIIDVNECWNWQKSCNSAGYGQLTENKKYWLAHRYAYACVNTDLNQNQVLRHMCHNTKCCNPEHLVLGTHRENYHDSLENHHKANLSKRKMWLIGDVSYPTIREAAKQTRLHQSTIIKYTVNGVFDIDAYRLGCKIANKLPKL